MRPLWALQSISMTLTTRSGIWPLPSPAWSSRHLRDTHRAQVTHHQRLRGRQTKNAIHANVCSHIYILVLMSVLEPILHMIRGRGAKHWNLYHPPTISNSALQAHDWHTTGARWHENAKMRGMQRFFVPRQITTRWQGIHPDIFTLRTLEKINLKVVLSLDWFFPATCHQFHRVELCLWGISP